MRMSHPLTPVTRMPTENGSVTDDASAVACQRTNISGTSRSAESPPSPWWRARTLPDVPGVHRVVDELEDREELGGQWPHVGMRHDQARPRLVIELLERSDLLVEVNSESRIASSCDSPRKRLGVRVGARRHHRETHRLGRRGAGVPGFPARKVALRRIDHVPDDVADLPSFARRACAPAGYRRGSETNAKKSSASRRMTVSTRSRLAGSMKSQLLVRHKRTPPRPVAPRRRRKGHRGTIGSRSGDRHSRRSLRALPRRTSVLPFPLRGSGLRSPPRSRRAPPSETRSSLIASTNPNACCSLNLRARSLTRRAQWTLSAGTRRSGRGSSWTLPVTRPQTGCRSPLLRTLSRRPGKRASRSSRRRV